MAGERANRVRIGDRSEPGPGQTETRSGHVAANVPVTLHFPNLASLQIETRDIGLGGLSVESGSSIPDPVSRVTMRASGRSSTT